MIRIQGIPEVASRLRESRKQAGTEGRETPQIMSTRPAAPVTVRVPKAA